MWGWPDISTISAFLRYSRLACTLPYPPPATGAMGLNPIRHPALCVAGGAGIVLPGPVPDLGSGLGLLLLG